MTSKSWIYDPQSGGRKIPDAIKPRIHKRIVAHAHKHYAGKFSRIEVRFSGKFCYIDAYTEPFVPPDYNPELFGGNRVKNVLHSCVISPLICAAFGSLVTKINGRWPSIPTAI